jgi:hypothetical protein
MMENNEMIYTAIFQGAQGKLHSVRYLDVVSRKVAWLAATRLGASTGECLIALVSGDHPVYFYENFVEDTAREDRTPTQNHDVFEMT